jgi:hypothetical protein
VKCGARRYQVEAEVNGEKQSKSILARTPAEARKKFRSTFGADAQINTVKEIKRYTN